MLERRNRRDTSWRLAHARLRPTQSLRASVILTAGDGAGEPRKLLIPRHVTKAGLKLRVGIDRVGVKEPACCGSRPHSSGLRGPGSTRCDIRLLLAVLLPAQFSAGVSFIQDVLSIICRPAVKPSMSAIGVAPVPQAGKHQDHKAEPKHPSPAEVPVVPKKVVHLYALRPPASLRPVGHLRQLRSDLREADLQRGFDNQDGGPVEGSESTQAPTP